VAKTGQDKIFHYEMEDSQMQNWTDVFANIQSSQPMPPAPTKRTLV